MDSIRSYYVDIYENPCDCKYEYNEVLDVIWEAEKFSTIRLFDYAFYLGAM